MSEIASSRLPCQEVTEGLAPVAVLTFLLHGEFGKGPVQSREVEERIVAKTLRASRRGQQLSMGLTGERCQGFAAQCQGNCAYIFSRKFSSMQLLQLCDESSVV